MPSLRPDALAGHLARGLAPLYFLHGDEPLLVIESADAIRTAARAAGHTEREVLVSGTPGFQWDQLAIVAGSLSLFGGGLLVEVRVPNGKPGQPGAKALVQHARALPPGTVTLITMPAVEWQSQKAEWFKTLVSAGVEVRCDPPPLAQLPDWLGARLARQQQRAPRPALEFIAGLVEGNLLAAHQEIQKLGLLYPPGELTAEQVEAAVLNVARYDADALREALLAGDGRRLVRVMAGLRGEDVPLPLLLWTVANELRAAVDLRAALDRGQRWDDAVRARRVHPGRAGGLRALVQRSTRAQLEAAVLHAARIDRMIKGVARGQPWDELLQLALGLGTRRYALSANA